MKKSLIVTGAASLAVAAMPVAGVFATDYQSVTDEIEVIVNTVCNMRSGGTPTEPTTGGAELTATVNPGTLIGDTGGAWTGTPTTLTYNCNDTGGWQITAQGVSSTEASATAQTVLKASNNTSTDIATGEATSGATSNWAFKVSGTGAASGYTTFKPVPNTATVVASSSDPVSQGTLNPTYRAWISLTQEADTYTGYVKYLLTAPLQ